MAALSSDTALQKPAVKNMASMSPSMTNLPAEETSLEDTRYFDFFGLPRELRDMVYAQPGLSDEHLCRRDDKFELKTTVRKPSTSMLLVNHQFSREYKESDGIQVTILAEDILGLTHLPALLRLSKKDSIVSHLEARLVILDGEELDLHIEWLAHCSMRATALRSINIELYVWEEFVNNGCLKLGDAATENLVTGLINLDKLHRLHVYFCEDVFCDEPSRKHQKMFLARWERGDDAFLKIFSDPVKSANDWNREKRTPGGFFGYENLEHKNGTASGEGRMSAEASDQDSSSEDEQDEGSISDDGESGSEGDRGQDPADADEQDDGSASDDEENKSAGNSDQDSAYGDHHAAKGASGRAKPSRSPASAGTSRKGKKAGAAAARNLCQTSRKQCLGGLVVDVARNRCSFVAHGFLK